MTGSMAGRMLRSLALAAFAAALFAHPGPAAAQATFSYIGPAWSTSECTSATGYSAPPCIDGSLTASVTLNVGSGYTGHVPQSGIIAYALNGSGVGSLNSLGYLTTSDFDLTSGQISNWLLQALQSDGIANELALGTANGGSSYDRAQRVVSSSTTAYGYIVHPPDGTWINPKILGKPWIIASGGCCAGDPISIGSGNLFEQVQDYATAGQNPLAFTRYYNSMATPDTYAVTMGQNWRTIFDRYLHIINPSAIYGVVAERPDGQVISFSSSSGTYTPDSDVDYSLTKSGSTWTLKDPNDTTEIYFASGGKATLQSITLRNGYTQAINYTSGQISYVSDSYGRQLGLSYSSAGMLSGVTTPDTLALSYGYVAFASAHILTTVSYNTSPATHQTYLYENVHNPYALTGITDENGHRYATWAYDAYGEATSSQLATGADYTQISYDSSTGNRTVTGPLGIAETYKFTTLQGVPKVTEIDRAANGSVASATSYITYDSSGYLKTRTDWNGNQTAYTNNAHGLPTQIVYASGSPAHHTTTITYDGTWAHLAATIVEQGVTTGITYDSSGNMATRTLTDTTSQSVPYSTNGQTRTWHYTWTPTGQLKTRQLPRLDVTAKTTYGYTGGTLTSVTDALSHTTTAVTFQSGGRPLTVTDPNSVLTTYTYSTREWPTSGVLSVSGGSLTTSITYDSAGNLTKTTLPDSSYLTYGYDDAHRVTSITNPLSETQGITYDSAGNVTQTLWKNASAVTKRQHTATFDALGRILHDIGGEGQTTATTYDSNSNWVSITDPLGHISYRSSDQLNRLTKFKDAAKNLSQIAYDSASRPLTVTDPKSNATTYVYDGFGEAIQEDNPDAGKTIYYYDKDGNVSEKLDANSAETDYTYDADDRILTRAYPADSSLNVAFTYDQGGHGDGIGRLTSMTDAVGSLSRSYDERGNLITDARTISGHVYTTGYTFESAGRLASVTYASSGWLASYAYDSAGQTSSVTAKQPGHSPTNIATSVTHMPFGPVSGFTYGNGVTDTRTYDLDYRTTAIKDTGTGNIVYSSYGYDADNNVSSVTDHVNPGWTQALTYDVIDQINYASGPYGVISQVKYDSGGNWTKYDTTTYQVWATSNRLKKIGGSTNIVYDSAGHMTAGIDSSTMTWNKAGQLANIAVFGNTAYYANDGFGWRVTAHTGTNPVSVQLYDQSGNYLERSSSAVKTNYVWMDGFPVADIKPSTPTITALHTDPLAAPVKGTDASKAVVWTAYYSPFGGRTTTGSIQQDLWRKGVVSINSTNVNRNGYRDFSFQSNVFYEPDPLGGQNRFVANRNNPLKFVDPWGLEESFSNGLPGEICIQEGGCSVIGGGGGMFGGGGPSVPAEAVPVAEGQCSAGEIAGGAQSALAGPALARQLAAESAASRFTPEGALSADSITRSIERIPSTDIGNPNIPWGYGKYVSESYRSPSGDFQVRFYMNSQTGEVEYGIDYKTIFTTGPFKR
ncbi:MAG: DUF6531 domain-containing protein [Methylocella sp.]